MGDGDLSFSVALARSGAAVEASTLAVDARELAERYPRSRAHAAELPTIHFGLDATNLDGLAGYFDRVIFNFPCVDVDGGLDGQNPLSGRCDAAALEANRRLVADFIQAAARVLKPHGEIVIAHKTLEPFCWWQLTRFRTSRLRCRGAVVLDRAAFPPYANRKAREDKGFAAADAVFYVYAPRLHQPQNSIPPPTLPPGPATKRDENPRKTLFARETRSQLRLTTVDARGLLVPVTPSLLASIRAAVGEPYS